MSISSPTTSSKKRMRRPGAPAADPRQPLRQAEDIERVERPERLEIARDRAPERIRIALEPGREDRPLEHVERHARHLEGDVEDAAVGRRRQRRTRRSADRDHRRHEARDVARREQRREGAPLQPPLLALGREQPVAEPGRQHAALEVVLAVVCGVVDEHMPDRRRVVDDRDAPERAFAGEDQVLEMVLGPGGERIRAQRREEIEHVGRGPARDRGRRAERRFGGDQGKLLRNALGGIEAQPSAP